jgi:hypothetical protein
MVRIITFLFLFFNINVFAQDKCTKYKDFDYVTRQGVDSISENSEPLNFLYKNLYR